MTQTPTQRGSSTAKTLPRSSRQSIKPLKVKQTQPQTSSSARAADDRPAEVVIEYEPMVSRDPIIWNNQRYDYVFKVAHINSARDGWHIYCCEKQIAWVLEAKQSKLVLTQGHDFTNESGCKVVGGELCGAHRSRTILHQGLFVDDEPIDDELVELSPLQSELPKYEALANELGESVDRLMQRFGFNEETAGKLVITAFLN